MSEFSLRQLTYFLSIVESGSFRDAAVASHVAESTVASALDQLEKTLGLQLCLRRKAHGVTLTSDGRVVAQMARDLVGHADRFAAEIGELAGNITGPVTLGCPQGLAPTVLPPILDRLRSEFPRIVTTSVVGYRSELLSKIWGGELDLVVLPGGAVPPGLRSEPLFSAPVHAVLPPNHRLAHGEGALHLSELAGEPMILLDIPEGSARTFELFRALGQQPQIHLRTNSFELARALVARGFGYTLQVQRPWGDHSYEGLPLAIRPLVPSVGDEVVRIAWPAAVTPTARVRTVIDMARTVLSDRSETERSL